MAAKRATKAKDDSTDVKSEKKSKYKKSSYQKKSYSGKPYQKQVIERIPQPERDWSSYQQNIFNDVANGTGHTIIQAFAGTAKTTTIVKSFDFVPPGKKVLMCAFNKIIRDELAQRAPASVAVNTLHSLGYKTLLRINGNSSVNTHKMIQICEDLIPENENRKNTRFDIVGSLARAVSLCKGFLAETDKEILDVLDQYGIEIFDDTLPNFIANIKKAYKESIDRYYSRKEVDYDDMCWLPIKLNLSAEKFDMVFIDEMQDLNMNQIRLAISHCSKEGRIIGAGDSFQAIYGFRGAKSNIMDIMQQELNAKVLTLPITYRCAKNIVESVHDIVPNFESAPNAIDGIVDNISLEDMKKRVRGGDFILSRTNAPMMSLCLSFLKEGRKAMILGRDFGDNLKALVKKSKAKKVEELISWLIFWSASESKRLKADRKDDTLVLDKKDCLISLCEGEELVSSVNNKIDNLFSDRSEESVITLSTTHKAKGLERERVFVLNYTYRSTWGMLQSPNEEKNLVYVAYTRAKNELYLVRK